MIEAILTLTLVILISQIAMFVVITSMNRTLKGIKEKRDTRSKQQRDRRAKARLAQVEAPAPRLREKLTEASAQSESSPLMQKVSDAFAESKDDELVKDISTLEDEDFAELDELDELDKNFK